MRTSSVDAAPYFSCGRARSSRRCPLVIWRMLCASSRLPLRPFLRWPIAGSANRRDASQRREYPMDTFSTLLILLWENLFSPPRSGYFVRGLVAAAISLTGPFGIIALVRTLVACVCVWRRGGVFRVANWICARLSCWRRRTNLCDGTNASPTLEFGTPPYMFRCGIRLIREIFVGLLPAPNNVSTVLGLIPAVAFVSVALASSAHGVCLLLAPTAVAIWLLGAARTNPIADHMFWYGTGARYIYAALLFAFSATLLPIETTTLAVCVCHSASQRDPLPGLGMAHLEDHSREH
ncbi:hypothetical protein R8871_01990 [Paraburkholderia graminis C4D1M]|uniref:Uncharacterized protein n=1 Tax=Paraburkholderia graminis (strain ATCC 700544 / DSM 17151 / LMG 18924 / NCIMB 13744 / C4D1M) TaxID=396598 RepID=B1FXL0_PARG4|nr:hypothetical protein BgramDRAFT_2078 [Paraburkholderia graminis C4D1M]CAB3670608.1 hypothetical protein R8871_01990 [Paraburkholderia graminis C4D1M]